MHNLNWLINTSYTTLYAFLWACMEIEIEGKDGWAANLPTTSFLESHFTWYHVFMNLIVSLTMGRLMWSQGGIFHCVFYIAEWFLLEDFLWFALNPDFGLEKYTPEHIWWHAKQPWYFGMPLHNYIALSAMMICSDWTKNKELQKSWNFMIFVTLSFVILNNYI